MSATAPPPSPAWSDPARRAEAARLAVVCMDLTELASDCSPAHVERLCAKAAAGHGAGDACIRPAAVCVWPAFVAQARAALPASVAVAAVVNFPGGNEALAEVLRQIDRIAQGGGQEVDAVLPWQALQAGERDAVRHLLAELRRASAGLRLKIILESGMLADAGWVNTAAVLALEAGADFLKTSTGKTPVGATPAAADILLAAIARDPQRAARGFKPSGGIRTVADAAVYMDRVQQQLGAEALVPARFRIGASGLFDTAVQVLDGVEPRPDTRATY